MNHNKKLQVDIPGKQKSQARVVIRRMLREKVRLRLLNPDLNVDKSWNQARNQLNKELDEGIGLSSNAMGIIKLWYRYGNKPMKLYEELEKRRKNKSFSAHLIWEGIDKAFADLVESYHFVNNLFASSFEDASDNILTGQMDSNLDDSLDEDNGVIESSKSILLDLCLIPKRNCIFEDIYFEAGFNRMSATQQKQTFDIMMNGGTYSTILGQKAATHRGVGFSCSINSLVGLIYRKSSGEIPKHINPLQVFVCTLQSNKDSGGQDTASATGTGNVGVNTSAINPMLSERIRLVNRLRQENISADCTFEANPTFLHQKNMAYKKHAKYLLECSYADSSSRKKIIRMIKMNSLSHTQYKSNKASQQRSNKADKKQKWLTFNSIEEVIQYIN